MFLRAFCNVLRLSNFIRNISEVFAYDAANTFPSDVKQLLQTFLSYTTSRVEKEKNKNSEKHTYLQFF